MNAAVYCRKSTDDERTAADGKSIARQEQRSRDFALTRGWPVVEAFSDDGVSGAEFVDRPGFARLLAAAKRKPRPFDAVVMMEHDRLGRDQARVMMALTDLHDAGVKVFAYQTGQEVRMGTPTEILIASVEAFAGAAFRHAISLNTREALRAKAARGHSTGQKPFGCEIVRVGDHAELRVVQELKRHVLRVFELAAEPMGDGRVASALNKERVPAPGGTAWTKEKVRKVLSNRVYLGELIHGKTASVDRGGKAGQRVVIPQDDWVVMKIPELQIVPDKLWAKVHASKAEAREHYGGGAADTGRPFSEHLLNSIARCGACGGPLIHIKKNDRTAPRYYCSKKARGGDCKNGRGVPMDLLNEFVRLRLTEMLTDDERVAELSELVRERRERWNREHALKDAARENLQREARKLESAIVQLTNSIESGKAVGERLRQRERELAEVRAKLDAKPLPRATKREVTDKIRYLIAPLVDRAPYGRVTKEARAKISADVAEVRACLRKLGVERIIVTPQGGGWHVRGAGDLAGLIGAADDGEQTRSRGSPGRPPTDFPCRRVADRLRRQSRRSTRKLIPIWYPKAASGSSIVIPRWRRLAAQVFRAVGTWQRRGPTCRETTVKLGADGTIKPLSERSSVEPVVRLIPLGGLGEIGLNMMLIESGEDLLAIDCGLMFPDDELPGIDHVIPDFSYALARREAFRAVVLTHGHEDHIGALPYLLREVPVPVYGTPLTLALVAERLREHGLAETADLRVIRPRDRFETGPFGVEAIRVTHSIVDGIGLAIDTPAGTIVHTGDFKLDPSPLDGEPPDYRRFAELGEQGVMVLCSDSTNVERPGHTRSEMDVGQALGTRFDAASGRIIVATFASHIHRIQQVLTLAARTGRRVALLGMSMQRNVTIASDLGYLRVPPNVLVELEELAELPADRQVILSTGSQGEPHSALALMAAEEHKYVRIERGDLVIISARVIPGHERTIGRVVNALYRLGAEVLYEDNAFVHVSGHASQEDLKMMFNLTRPRYFIPVHGEYRHLLGHARLAETVGIVAERVFLIEDGMGVEVSKTSARLVGRFPAGRVLVDGKSVGDIGAVVLRDRQLLAEDGLVAVSLAVARDGAVLAGPEIASRGFVYVKENEPLLEELKKAVLAALAERDPDVPYDRDVTGATVRMAVRQFVNQRFRRRPVVLPIILEV